MNILFVGDVFGKPGREALLRWLPGFTEENAVDFVIANGENAANGAGITSKIAERLLAGGVDVITTGNHVWRQKEVYTFLATDERIVRPANYPAGAPGRGLTVRPAADGAEVAVINLAGELFLQTGMSPFRIVDRLVDEAQQLAETIVVDLHAEATSEKVAMGHYLDGRVTAVLGTHTHVQTSDARVLPGGTAYMTDVGMTGPARLGDRRAHRHHPAALHDRAAAGVRGRGRAGAPRRGAHRRRRRPGDLHRGRRRRPVAAPADGGEDTRPWHCSLHAAKPPPRRGCARPTRRATPHESGKVLPIL